MVNDDRWPGLGCCGSLLRSNDSTWPFKFACKTNLFLREPCQSQRCALRTSRLAVLQGSANPARGNAELLLSWCSCFTAQRSRCSVLSPVPPAHWEPMSRAIMMFGPQAGWLTSSRILPFLSHPSFPVPSSPHAPPTGMLYALKCMQYQSPPPPSTSYLCRSPRARDP